MSPREMRAAQDEIAKLKAENAALRKESTANVSMKVSEKGGLSLYGIGRFPVTLYKGQWLKVLDMVDDIRQFIDDHPELKEKL